MLKNILVISFRHMVRNKAFTIINVFGLAVSMSLAMLMLTIIHEQLSFDDFHTDRDRIFRVNSQVNHAEWGIIDFACAPLPLGDVLRQSYGVASHVVRVNRQLRGEASFAEVKVPLKGLFTEPSFLDVFHFPLMKGDKAGALQDPFSLVLTQEAAEKIFGRTDVVGQSVAVGSLGEFEVTGVLEHRAGKTHFDFEALASISTLASLEKRGKMAKVEGDWSAYFDNYVYLKVPDASSVADVERALDEVSRRFGSGLLSDGKEISYAFYLQPLGAITPGPELSGNMGAGIPSYMLGFLSALAGLVLLMSLFNYTNLTIAKSLSRAREIGVRKVAGAKRHQVFGQFVGEAMVFSFLSLGGAYVILQFLKAGFLELSFREDFFIDLNEDLSLYGIFIVFAAAVGLLAGLLPAVYLSSLQPVRVLKDVQAIRVYSKLTFRRILLVTQFTLSVVCVMIVSIMYQQLDFMLAADYGIEEKSNLTVDLQGQPYRRVAPVIRALPGVERVGGISQRLGTWDGGSGQYRARPGDPPVVAADFRVDEHYVENLALDFLAGKNFDPAAQSGGEREIILNQSAVQKLGFASAAEAIGEVVLAEDTLPLRIAGVVKDFHFRPLTNAVGPLALRRDVSKLRYLSVNVQPSRQPEVVEAMRSAWKLLDPVHPLDVVRMADEIDEAYADTGMRDMLVIMGYAAVLVITLACLGMLGMALYMAKVRTKEVGIRKVMGASSSDVLVLLGKSYMALIAAAILVGMPISYVAGEIFLESYPYRVSISPMLMGAVVMLILSLSIIMVWSQTRRVATANPVRWLRNE